MDGWNDWSSLIDRLLNKGKLPRFKIINKVPPPLTLETYNCPCFIMDNLQALITLHTHAMLLQAVRELCCCSLRDHDNEPMLAETSEQSNFLSVVNL